MIRLGAHASGDTTRFALFTTTASRCAVKIGDRVEPLTDKGDGFWEASVSGAGPGTRYRFLLGDRELPDPYARFLPDGVHGEAMVVEDRYAWKHPAVARPLREHVIYELHVGTFTTEGTYDAARARLPDLARLGVTAIELMPLSSFPGRRGWGYDGVAHFAPFAGYGSPDALCRFIDEAHGLGLAVLLDVVYNHFGPSGNYLGAYSPAYFTKDIQTPWGDAPDFTHPVMRAYLLDNARYWLDEFRFDGLRLDAVHAIVDPSDEHVLAELAELARPKILIAEDERKRLDHDGVWADGFHHHVRVTLTGEREGYYAKYTPGVRHLAALIEDGYGRAPVDKLVFCIQNHDQIGNRATGDRLGDAIPIESYRAVSTLLLLLPMTPLLFMGQEWAARTPFLYFTDHEPDLGKLVTEGRRKEFAGFTSFAGEVPDPQADDTFERSKLRWDDRDASTLALYTELLALRKNDPVLRAVGREGLSAEAHDEVLVVRMRHGASERRLIVNFGSEPFALGNHPVLFASGPISDGELPPRTAALLQPNL